jgi:small subunit ribosomal protein S20
MEIFVEISKEGWLFFGKHIYLQSFLRNMANHKSAIKRIRANETKRDLNRYQHKTARTVVKNIRKSTSKVEAEKMLNGAASLLDKLAKRNIIHKNKASNLKSSLTKYVATLS